MGELVETNETDDSHLAIADICLSNDSSLVAVAIQR
jgi:tRNA (guanine-N(7)-)-methyltransferase subunit TRM82